MDGTAPVKTVGILPAIKRSLVPVIMILVAGMGASALVIINLPQEYTTRAAMVVRPPFPDEDMRDAVPRRDEQVQSLRVKLTASPLLVEVARESRLYEEGPGMGPDEIAARFREDLTIALDRNRAFIITLRGREPHRIAHALNLLVQKVSLQETALYLNMTQSVVDWLQGRTASLDGEIDSINRRIEEFKAANTGRLPEQVASNLTMLANAHERLVMDAAEEAREVREANRSLALLEAEALGDVLELEARYGDLHPDVLRARRTLDGVSQLRDSKDGKPVAYDRARIVERLENQVKEIEERLLKTPVVAERLSNLMEGRRLAVERHERLLSRLEEVSRLRDMAAGVVPGAGGRSAAIVPVFGEGPSEVVAAAALSVPAGGAGAEEGPGAGAGAMASAEPDRAATPGSVALPDSQSPTISGGIMVVESAQTPLAATSPNRPFLLGAALLVIVALALCVAVAREAGRQTFLNGKEVGAALSDELLVSIPKFKRGRGGGVGGGKGRKREAVPVLETGGFDTDSEGGGGAGGRTD